MSPERKRVLITGAGSGIGRALAVEAARRGMAVALCGRRAAALQATRVLLQEPDRHFAIAADITDAADRRRIVGTIKERWPALDVLINNAGVVEGGGIEQVDDEAVIRTFLTNVVAPMALTRDLKPLLAAARPSTVINIGSIFGDIAYPGLTAYSASKFALRGFSSGLRREWKRSGIDVTYAAPRATQTDAIASLADFVDPSGSVDAPGDVAGRIWRAAARGRDSIYAPGLERLFVLVERLFPRIIDRALSRRALAH